jgi:hypothetical protein
MLLPRSFLVLVDRSSTELSSISDVGDDLTVNE